MSEWLKKLAGIVGAANVVTAAEERAFYAMDAFWTGPPVAAVVRPGSVEELAAAVREITAAGLPVVPRGGGMSYTRGYVPLREQSVSIDMQRLDRIIEINETDMVVTVQGGCTWQTLHETLVKKDLRIPFFGPLSGARSTVGGSLANNSMFFGSGVYGSAADNVLALTVVLADGRIVRTGTRANRGDQGFNRYFGPDLSGVFLSDGGALGIKAEISLKLMRRPEHTDCVSFGFDTFDHMFAAQSEIARLRLVADCFGMDPFLNSRSKLKGPMEAVEVAAAVMRNKGSLWNKIKDLLGMAAGGTRFLDAVPYSLHIAVDGISRSHVAEILQRVRQIAGRTGAEIAGSIPKAIRATPFRPVGEFLVGRDGERWVPIHALVPLSKGKAVYEAVQNYFNSRQDTLEQFSIQHSQLTALEGTSLIIEPAFYYPDRLNPYHLRYLDAESARRYADNPLVPGANEAVIEMLSDLSNIFAELGAAHHQIGKFYPYRTALAPETWTLIEGIKQLTDPKGLMNPGALGLGVTS